MARKDKELSGVLDSEAEANEPVDIFVPVLGPAPEKTIAEAPTEAPVENPFFIPAAPEDSDPWIALGVFLDESLTLAEVLGGFAHHAKSQGWTFAPRSEWASRLERYSSTPV